MAMSGGRDDGAPMMEMNTTPLIDVMLVLLVMIIMTIPLATHSLDVDMNGGPPVKVEIRDANRLILTQDDRILWNDNAIGRDQLSGVLRQTARMAVEPSLEFEPQAGARYDLAAQVIATIRRSGVTNFGFVGNERFAHFDKPE